MPLIGAILAMAVAAPLLGQEPPGRERRRIEIVNGREVVAGEAIVRFRADRAGRSAVALDLESDRPVGRGLRRLRSRVRSTRQLLASLAGRPDVLLAEPNYVVRPTAVPNDRYFPSQWSLLNATTPGAIGALDAWDTTTGSAAAVIGLIDSGVDYRHPDLAPNIWSAPAPFTVTIGDTAITCPAGSHGFNALTLSCDPLDDYGHGTAMAGLIGAAGNNSVGITGVNWNTSIMAIKFLGADGWGSYADAINAIEFAIQVRSAFAQSGGAHVRVLSNSWAGTAFSQALLDEITRANAAGLLFVASAGNTAEDDDQVPEYPASFNAPGIVSVAATTREDTLQPYSNFGRTTIDLGAPAADYSTAIGGGYASTGGTSAATALVSGAAALVLSACDLTNDQLKATLLEGSDPVPALSAITVSGGRLNVARSLSLCTLGNLAPIVTIATPASGARFDPAASITITADAYDSDGSIRRVDFYAGAMQVGSDATSPYRATWIGAPAGVFAISAVATDNHGATRRSDAVSITIESPASAVPTPWETQDIGSVGAAGSLTYSGGTFTVNGAGADIWSQSDQFRYVYQPLDRDGAITARVAFVEAVAPWTKAGVMIRDSLDPSSAHASLFVTPGKGVAFQRRVTAGSLSSHTAGPVAASPYWVRLTRSGAAIVASVSADGSSWVNVGQEPLVTGRTVYVGLAVSSHVAGTPALAMFDSVSVLHAPAAPALLPDGWRNLDIGGVGVRGAATADAGSFTVSGAGADVWGTADAFHFVYRALDGDGEITARVASVEGVRSWTKAGVMIRSALEPSAAHAFLLVSSAKGVAFQRRPQPNAESTSTLAVSEVAPYWVRLTRTGPLITARISTDGASWTRVGTQTLPLNAVAYVGLAVSSHEAARAAKAIFDHVAVTGAGLSPAPAVLPSGWAARDIGSVGTPGASAESDGLFVVAGSGADIWGTADAFQFAYRTLAGDGHVQARVARIDDVDRWTKAGVMIRQSLDADAVHASMFVSPGKGLAFQRRRIPGDSTAHTFGGSGGAPRWVRLTRVGRSIVAAMSVDGESWSDVGRDTIAFSGPVYVGLAVSSHVVDQIAKARFTDVVISTPNFR